MFYHIKCLYNKLLYINIIYMNNFSDIITFVIVYFDTLTYYHVFRIHIYNGLTHFYNYVVRMPLSYSYHVNEISFV